MINIMKKNQKKLILFMPSIEGGGVEKNIFLIGNYLAKYIENIFLITFDKKFIYKFKKKIQFISLGISTNHKVNKYLKYFTCLIFLIYSILKNNRKVVVFAFQANIYCILICKIFQVPIITRSNSSPSGWSKNFIKNYIFKKILKTANSIIVNSKEFKNEIDKKFNLNSTLIYNPLNINEIKKNSKFKFKFKFFKSEKELKIINIARFTDQKDHLTLLKSFDLIRKKIDSKLLLIGYGKNKSIIEKFIKLNNLEKNVKIINFQKNPYKFLKLANIFILTSRYEGLPNVLLEALTLKKFIISTDCPTGPKEILENGKFGFLTKVKDHNMIYKKVILYNNNKKKLNNKILKGYKSLKKYDFKKNCNEYYKVVSYYL